MTDMQPVQGQSEIILCPGEDGQAEINLKASAGSVWLTQLEIAELFAATKQSVSLQIENIQNQGEPLETSVVRNFRTTASDGKHSRWASLPFLPTCRSASIQDSLTVRPITTEKHAGWMIEQRETQRQRWTLLGFMSFNPSYPFRHTGRDCRYPGHMDVWTEPQAIHGDWVPAPARARNRIPAGTTAHSSGDGL